MNFELVMQLIGRWGGTLKFFPTDPDARIGIAEEILAMASYLEQVRWLVGRVPKLYAEWPGTLEVRAVFCSKFPAKDGIEPSSAVYLEGIPSERDQAGRLPPAPLLRLAAGEPVTGDPEAAEILIEAGRRTRMPRL